MGTAYTIVQITFFDTKNQTNFTTPEYHQHPTSYSQNNWGIGIGLIAIGLALASSSFFQLRRMSQREFSAAGMTHPMGAPYQQPYRANPQTRQ